MDLEDDMRYLTGKVQESAEQPMVMISGYAAKIIIGFSLGYFNQIIIIGEIFL